MGPRLVGVTLLVLIVGHVGASGSAPGPAGLSEPPVESDIPGGAKPDLDEGGTSGNSLNARVEDTSSPESAGGGDAKHAADTAAAKPAGPAAAGTDPQEGARALQGKLDALPRPGSVRDPATQAAGHPSLHPPNADQAGDEPRDSGAAAQTPAPETAQKAVLGAAGTEVLAAGRQPEHDLTEERAAMPVADADASDSVQDGDIVDEVDGEQQTESVGPEEALAVQGEPASSGQAQGDTLVAQDSEYSKPQTPSGGSAAEKMADTIAKGIAGRSVEKKSKQVDDEQMTRKRMQTEEEKQLSSLITDASAEGRTRRPQDDDSARDAGRGGGGKPVLVQTARDREIRELLRNAERYRYGVSGSKVDYKGALEAYSAASQLGSFQATALLGELYKHGLGVKRDLAKAVSLFKESADAGDPTGQRNLGVLYATGVGVKEDQALALLHYHFASVGGDHMAQLAMGYRHMHGINVPKNCQAAVAFYKPAVDAVAHDVQQFRPPPMMERHSLAPEGSRPRPEELDEDVVDYYQYSAARGDPSAQVALGQLYYFGARGLEQNYAEALKWYLLAAEQGDGNAMGHIGNMYVQGTHVKACNATALKYFRQGSDKGNGIAINGLGYMHMYGLGLDQSFPEAMKLFSQAAEQGNLEARFNLGALYVGGHGVSKDYAKAIYYFTLAANRGHMLALYNLAMMHLNGFGTPRSCPNALQFLKSVGERGSWGLRLQQAYKMYHQGKRDESLLLYLEAAELGYEVAQGNVAFMYDEGGTPLSGNKKEKALAAFEHSALQGNAAAELKIGDYYYYGRGTAVNYRKAVSHYRAASEARNAQVMMFLAM